MLAFLAALNSLSPLGLAALLGLDIYRQVGTMRHMRYHEETLREIRGNDLAELPDILATLQRIERENASSHATIIAKLNGHS